MITSTQDTARLKRSEAGFTLLEMLVSMAVLSLLMALVATSVQIMSDGWRRGGAAANVHDMLGRANDVLRRDLSALRRIVIVDKAKKPRFVFFGDATAMTFVAREPPFPTRPGLYIVRLSVSQRDGRTRLVRSRMPYNEKLAAELKSGGQPLQDAVAVLSGQFDVSMAYRSETASWKSSWSDAQEMPSHIKVQVKDRGSSRAFPDIVMRITATAEQGCTDQKACTTKSNGKLPAKFEPPKKAKPKSVPARRRGDEQTERRRED